MSVWSDIPGEVDIWFVLNDGQLPEQAIIEELEQYLMGEEIRPLTDKVVVGAPDIEAYDVDFTYYINRSDRSRISAINEQIQSAVRDYVRWQKEKIGRDINPDQLRKMVVSAGAKRLDIRSPDFRRISRRSIALLEKEALIIYGGVEDD